MSPEQIQIIIYCATAIGGFVLAAIPSIIGIVASIKKAKNAKNIAETEAATNELTTASIQLITEAEELYKSLDKAMKAEGQSAGSLKKDSVLTKLQNYAARNNLAFDVETWSTKIDELVAITRKVNVK